MRKYKYIIGVWGFIGFILSSLFMFIGGIYHYCNENILAFELIKSAYIFYEKDIIKNISWIYVGDKLGVQNSTYVRLEGSIQTSNLPTTIGAFKRIDSNTYTDGEKYLIINNGKATISLSGVNY